MEILKKALKSKSIWSGILKIIAGISLIATGEQSLQNQIPELLLGAWGIIDIIIRFKTDQPVGNK